VGGGGEKQECDLEEAHAGTLYMCVRAICSLRLVIPSEARDIGLSLRRQDLTAQAETQVPRFARDDKSTYGLGILELIQVGKKLKGP
jgi:hypothetical protein